MNKKILDACCGSRMFYFDKNSPDVLFQDIRKEDHQLTDRTLSINPDYVGDFRKMDFPDESFYLVVFDPPHLHKLGDTSWLAKKYGKLLPTWEMDIKAGFDECMRVLKPNGTLIFKWNQRDVKISKLLQVLGSKPLFGHTTQSGGETIWMCFFKSSDFYEAKVAE